MASLDHPLLDRYVGFVAARCRPNTVRATLSDLRAFFAVVTKEPIEVRTTDVLDFIASQRQPRPGRANVVRLRDGESGLSSRTIRRRLTTVSGLFGYLVMIEEMADNPAPRGLATRRVNRRRSSNVVSLVRTPHILPKVLEPAEVDALLGALRHWRDRAMVEAMVLVRVAHERYGFGDARFEAPAEVTSVTTCKARREADTEKLWPTYRSFLLAEVSQPPKVGSRAAS